MNKAKEKDNIEFSILKIGGGDDGLYKDRKFDFNYANAKMLDIPIGCYYFGHALTIEDAEKEVKHWLELMKPYKFEYPVFYDVEATMLSLNRRDLTNIVKYVVSTIEKNGYWVGIYASTSTFNNCLYDTELLKYSHWVAEWNKSGNRPHLNSNADVQMWQFGGDTNYLRTNKIADVTCDQNYCYCEYPSKIKERGLNGYTKETRPDLEYQEILKNLFLHGYTDLVEYHNDYNIYSTTELYKDIAKIY